MESIRQVFLDLLNSNYFPDFLVFLGAFFIRSLFVRSVMNFNFTNYERRRQLVLLVKNITFAALVILFFLIWGEELKSVAMSVSVAAVAVVVALKEVIMSFLGGILKTSSKVLSIGDRITIKGMRGEIIDQNLFTTTLFEIGPGTTSNQYTGRQIKIPNSAFLTESYFLTPSGNHFTLHVSVLGVPLDENIFKKQEILLKAAEEVSAPYAEKAKEYITNMCKKQNVMVPDLAPRVLYETPSPTTVEFHIRMPMPFKALTRTENKIKDIFYKKVFEEGL